MKQRKKLLFLLSVLSSIFMWCMPVPVQADVEWNTLSTLNLDKKPIDVITTMDGKWAYILTPGEVQVYSLSTKLLQGRIPVDKDIIRLSVSSKADQLYLINGKTNTLSLITVAFIYLFDMQGSPYKGLVDAPVVIVAFSDYQ